MGKKAEQKQEYIISCAKEVFRKKGYANVTMKDIVEECEISRGGLYLYFASVEEVFGAVLLAESRQSEKEGNINVSGDISATELLMLFLKTKREEILSGEKGLLMAIYEYYCHEKISDKENERKKQFEMEKKIVHKMIELGLQRGEFACEYPELETDNIMLTLEGMKIVELTQGLDLERIDENIAYMVNRLSV